MSTILAIIIVYQNVTVPMTTFGVIGVITLVVAALTYDLWLLTTRY